MSKKRTIKQDPLLDAIYEIQEAVQLLEDEEHDIGIDIEMMLTHRKSMSQRAGKMKRSGRDERVHKLCIEDCDFAIKEMRTHRNRVRKSLLSRTAKLCKAREKWVELNGRKLPDYVCIGKEY